VSRQVFTVDEPVEPEVALAAECEKALLAEELRATVPEQETLRTIFDVTTQVGVLLADVGLLRLAARLRLSPEETRRHLARLAELRLVYLDDRGEVVTVGIAPAGLVWCDGCEHCEPGLSDALNRVARRVGGTT
jgi:hypothetical protein